MEHTQVIILFFDIPIHHNPTFTWEYHEEDYSGFCYPKENIATPILIEETINEKNQKSLKKLLTK